MHGSKGLKSSRHAQAHAHTQRTPFKNQKIGGRACFEETFHQPQDTS